MKSRVVVHLKMKSESEGGRRAPFTEGYRAHFVVPPDGEYLGVTAIHCPGRVAPGDEAMVEFDLAYHPRVDYSGLQVGTQIEMREGPRAVATGRIERRIDDVSPDYKPPESREELLLRYASGERSFPETDVCDADLAGVTLDGANFEKFSWFFNSNFDGASLRGTSFRECNVKCTSFRRADLTGASFELAAVEATDFEGAKLEGVSFVGATYYGFTIKEGDHFPIVRTPPNDLPSK
jgi:hypothetical protein